MNTENPLVSIVTPTYNRSETISRAIESILDQQYPNFEALIVDDGSNDNTEEVVKSFEDPRLEYICHDTNRGANAARNTGIRRAQGDLISFLDSDDKWKTQKLSRDIATLTASDSETEAVYCGITHNHTDSRNCNANNPIYSGDIKKNLLTEGNFIGSFSALTATREAIKYAGELDERFPSYQDWEYYIRLSEVTDFGVTKEPLVVRHSGSWKQISDKLNEKHARTKPLMINKFSPVAREFGKRTEQKFKATVDYSIGHAALRNNCYLRARNSFINTIVHYPFHYKAWIFLGATIGGERTFLISNYLREKLS